jgi:hypothetical protein
MSATASAPLNAPPPLRGAVPVAQPALRPSADLLNGLGKLRTDLLQQSEAALARLQLSQLAALPRDGERGLLEWLFELPVRRGDDIDLWSLRVYREPDSQPRDRRPRPPCWSVLLAFDLPGLGPVQARVRLVGERVSTDFWAAHQHTVPLLNGHLHELRRSLSAVGLEVAELKCRAGSMPTAGSGDNKPLINERA